MNPTSSPPEPWLLVPSGEAQQVHDHDHDQGQQYVDSIVGAPLAMLDSSLNASNVDPLDEAEDALDTILESSVADMDAALNAAEEHTVEAAVAAAATIVQSQFQQQQQPQETNTTTTPIRTALLDAPTQTHTCAYTHTQRVPPSAILNGQRHGRWTLDEKLLFLYGLQQFGKGRWKKISAYVPQRSLVQIKSHAQKVLQRHAAGDAVFRRLEEHASQLHTLLLQAHERLAWDRAPTREQLSQLLTAPTLASGGGGRTMQPALGKRRRQAPPPPPPPHSKKKKGATEQILAASALCRLAGPDDDDADHEQRGDNTAATTTTTTTTTTVDPNELTTTTGSEKDHPSPAAIPVPDMNMEYV